MTEGGETKGKEHSIKEIRENEVKVGQRVQTPRQTGEKGAKADTKAA